MSEFWKSNAKHFCNYCKIYIADDKPSRAQHENGLRHKGAVERYIKTLYKKGAQEKRDKAEEASVLAAINRAVGDTTAPPAASTSKKPARAGSSNPFANYSDAASLNMVDAEYEAMLAAQKDAEIAEGNVGQWQTVRPVASSSRTVEEDEGLSAAERDERRPTSKTFKEKVLDNDELWDPATSIKLKSKSKVKPEVKEEETPAQAEAPVQPRAAFKAAFKRMEVAPEVKSEDIEPVADEPEIKPDPAEASDSAPAPTMFKKRKGGNQNSGGSSAQRRKLQ